MIILLFSAGLAAQETIVSVKVKKDGKVVKDTTYNFDDEIQAEHALMMMDMMGSEAEHQHEDHDGEHVKIIKYKIDGDDAEGKKVVVIKSEDGETFDILIDEDIEDEDGNIVKTKEVKVIVSGDEDGEWTVTEEKTVKKKSKEQ